MSGSVLDYWPAVPVAVLAVLLLYAVLMVPLQARGRGLGFWSWLALQFVALNPLYPLILIALLPNRAKMRRRRKYAAELDRKLMAAGRPLLHVAADTLPVPLDRSVGDLVTHDPALASLLGDRSTARPDRSVGDLPTYDGAAPPRPPLDRSLGDLPTHDG